MFIICQNIKQNLGYQGEDVIVGVKDEGLHGAGLAEYGQIARWNEGKILRTPLFLQLNAVHYYVSLDCSQYAGHAAPIG
jgi:hypothetical protein